VLEHRPRHDLAEALALEAEPGDETVEGGGQHLLVGRRGVDGVGTGERDPVAAEDGDTTSLGLHGLVCSSGVDARLHPCRCGWENKRGEGHVTFFGH
jgi:hypothetical protein